MNDRAHIECRIQILEPQRLILEILPLRENAFDFGKVLHTILHFLAWSLPY
jgi:hypothetical protein